jgi:DNA-binding SARP family transcriptional activator
LTTLQTYIYQLRRLLGPAEESVLVTRPAGYLLRVESGAVDLERFERLVQEGHAALDAGDAAHALQILREALAQWRGPALADVVAGPFLSAQAARLEESRISALEQRIDAELQLGLHRELIGELKSLVVAHPLRERYHAQLMVALYRSGRRVEALESYQRLRTVFVDELGLEPSPELQLLQQQVLSVDPALDPAPRVPPAATLATGVPTPAQLPPDIDDFVGRADTVDTIERRLVHTEETRTAVPVVMLAGMPGVGKTVTAVHAAQRLRGHFPGGQLTADLRGLTDDPADPADILAGFLRAVGIGDSQIPSSVEERSRLLRSWCADRRVLLLLDDAYSVAQVRLLLPGGTRCAVLITARRRLDGLAGAATIVLDVMRPPEAVQLLTTIVGHGRAGLEPSATEMIARHCGYLPLAIRAAATKLVARQHWPLSKLAVRLALEARQLSELQAGDLDIRACFEPSYRALGEGERRAFRQLSKLDEPEFPIWMAAVLLGTDAPTAETLLGRLTEGQLLRVTRREPDGEVYYGFHELLRHYAREMLSVTSGAGEPTLAENFSVTCHHPAGRQVRRTVDDLSAGGAARDCRPPAPGAA